MKDTTVLDSTEQINLEYLRELFLAHDFSTQTSRYKPATASTERNRIYQKASEIFRSFWQQQMSILCNKVSLLYYTTDCPIRCLEESEEKMVAGTVMELLKNEKHSIDLMHQVLDSMQEALLETCIKCAEAQGKAVEELTEEEIGVALDTLADEFLSRMMKMLLLVQNVPDLISLVKEYPAEEDFDGQIYPNYDKLDFERKWHHLRTKIGPMLSLTQEIQDSIPSPNGQITAGVIELGLIGVDTAEEAYMLLLNAFIDTLENDTDRQIIRMRADGKTQAEIAATLGYVNHSPISKRLQQLKKNFKAFIA